MLHVLIRVGLAKSVLFPRKETFTGAGSRAGLLDPSKAEPELAIGKSIEIFYWLK